MALTVRPDDEVYQFDTVWLGPDEYTLPIQARYVAWGTWLACFLVAAAVLVPIGGGGPGGVLGSLVWALALSVVLSRAVMLVVDHERPLRSLPALFSAEARAAVAARRRAERVLLVRPGQVRVRPLPEKVHALRDRQRRRSAARAAKASRRARGGIRRSGARPAELALDLVPEAAPPGADWPPAGPLPPEWGPAPGAGHDAGHEPWTGYDPSAGYDDELPDPVPGWSVPAPAEARPPVIPVLETALPPSPPQHQPSQPSQPSQPPPPAPSRTAPRPARPPAPARSAPAAASGHRDATPDRQAAVEARILLPARKDR